MSDVLGQIYPEVGAGGFTRLDGTIEFYGRLTALLRPEMTVVDLGAGRGMQFEDPNPYRRALVTIRGKVATVIGLDVDPAVLGNAHLDEAKVFDGETFPLADASVDLILSDWVLEHVEDPQRFASEVERVLRPGGWFCARTPAWNSLVAVASRLMPKRLRAHLLQHTPEGGRRQEDTFPAFYRLNSRRALRRCFQPARWEDYSYTFSPSPSYHFDSRFIARATMLVQYAKLPFGGENLFVFLRKRAFDDDDAE